MATTIINFDPFNPISVFRAERKMRERERKFEENVNRFLERLAQIGKESAQGAYGSAINVTVEPIENGMAIRANGKAIAFLEFGAGDATNSGNRYANVMPFDVEPGSWSKEHAQEYVKYGYWIFGGVKYTAIQPRNGMERAYEQIIQSIRDVAREVFES